MIFGLILLGVVPALGLAIWAAIQAWRGNWKMAAIALGLPLLLAALIAASALTGVLDSGGSEDWGPLMAMLFAAALAAFCLIAAVVAGIAGFFGHRRRAASVEIIF